MYFPYCNNWKWFVSSLCLGLLREKGTTVQKLFPDVLKSVYSLRLKGEQHLEGYNFQRTMDELIEGLNEKAGVVRRNGRRIMRCRWKKQRMNKGVK